MHTLVLTPWMTPICTVHWQVAITLWYLQKVDIVESYDEEIRSPSTSIKMPAVVRLRRASHQPHRQLRFSRVNVMTRDEFTCQYCGARLPMSKLNYDHVVPRRMGGVTEWDNIVACCYDGNFKKAGRTPDAAGMRLRRRPFRPSHLPWNRQMLGVRNVPEIWLPYVGVGDA